jgi:Na+/melibiose symporter-like transporter
MIAPKDDFAQHQHKVVLIRHGSKHAQVDWKLMSMFGFFGSIMSRFCHFRLANLWVARRVDEPENQQCQKNTKARKQIKQLVHCTFHFRFFGILCRVVVACTFIGFVHNLNIVILVISHFTRNCHTREI